jgi:hypothetical protein
MRFIAITPLIFLAACQVSDGENSVTVSYNQDVAENAIDDVTNAAEEAGNAIITGTKEAGETIENNAEKAKDKIENTDVDLTITNEAAR